MILVVSSELLYYYFNNWHIRIMILFRRKFHLIWNFMKLIVILSSKYTENAPSQQKNSMTPVLLFIIPYLVAPGKSSVFNIFYLYSAFYIFHNSLYKFTDLNKIHAVKKWNSHQSISGVHNPNIRTATFSPPSTKQLWYPTVINIPDFTES